MKNVTLGMMVQPADGVATAVNNATDGALALELHHLLTAALGSAAADPIILARLAQFGLPDAALLRCKMDTGMTRLFCARLHDPAADLNHFQPNRHV